MFCGRCRRTGVLPRLRRFLRDNMLHGRSLKAAGFTGPDVAVTG